MNSNQYLLSAYYEQGLDGWYEENKASVSSFSVWTLIHRKTHTGNKSLPWGGGEFVPNKGTKKI